MSVYPWAGLDHPPGPVVYDCLFFAWGLIAGLVVGGAIIYGWKYKSENITNAMLAAILLGSVGLVGHVLLVAKSDREPWLPLFDTTTLWWAALIVVGVAIPVIGEVTVGSVSIKLQKAKEISRDATRLWQAWMFTLSDLLAKFEDGGMSKDEAGHELTQFISLRAYEALKWIGQDDELRRLSIWLCNEDVDGLTFFFSDQIKDERTTTYKFRVGDGIIGIVYGNQEIWNEEDATEIPGWVNITGEEPKYRGLFCAPITYGELRLGVVSVDREKALEF